LVRGGWFDRHTIVRVKDNYVVQVGGADPKRAFPPQGKMQLPAEYDRVLLGLKVRPLHWRDPYARVVGHVDGWPVASDGRRIWLTHCYGMIGVGRDMPPDTGNGTELYAVIGHAPRHLDRNLAIVGRIVDGTSAIAALPRGTADGGFYASPSEYVPIAQVKVAADLPETQRPRYEVMRTDSETFAQYARASANRRDAFFVKAAGAIDLCELQIPSRRAQ
jgi:peptidylprolyl isomerase